MGNLWSSYPNNLSSLHSVIGIQDGKIECTLWSSIIRPNSMQKDVGVENDQKFPNSSSDLFHHNTMMLNFSIELYGLRCNGEIVGLDLNDGDTGDCASGAVSASSASAAQCSPCLRLMSQHPVPHQDRSQYKLSEQSS